MTKPLNPSGCTLLRAERLFSCLSAFAQVGRVGEHDVWGCLGLHVNPETTFSVEGVSFDFAHLRYPAMHDELRLV